MEVRGDTAELMSSAELVLQLRTALLEQKLDEVKTILGSDAARSVSTDAASAVQAIRDEVHARELLPALTLAMPKG